MNGRVVNMEMQGYILSSSVCPCVNRITGLKRVHKYDNTTMRDDTSELRVLNESEPSTVNSWPT